MEWFSSVDWAGMFIPSTPLLEIFLRGSVVYLSLFFLLRMVLKRQSGSVAMSDLLVVVLIADAAQNGMADDYTSLPDGIALVMTLIFWNFLLDWAAYHFPFVERLVSPPPLPLVKNGQLLHRNMRKEFITENELMSQLREQGVEAISQVKTACMEGNGKISVVRWKE